MIKNVSKISPNVITNLYFLGSVVPLAEICRFVIRQKIGKKGIKHGKIEKLPHLPKVIKTYLSHDQVLISSNDFVVTIVIKS